MGLRLNEGVELKKLKHITFLYNDEVLELQKQGIINVKKNNLRINVFNFFGRRRSPAAEKHSFRVRPNAITR